MEIREPFIDDRWPSGMGLDLSWRVLAGLACGCAK